MHGPNDALIADNKRRLQHAANRDEKAGPFAAEIVSEKPGRWHILKVVPGQLNIAAAHLIARRFGIYQPHYAKKVKGRFGKPDAMRRFPLFTSYLFVFIWNAEFHKRRILACPGVINFVMEAGHILTLSDQEIRKIQATENEVLGLCVSKKRSRRRRKGTPSDDASDIISITAYSAWSNISNQVAKGGDPALKKALGL